MDVRRMCCCPQINTWTTVAQQAHRRLRQTQLVVTVYALLSEEAKLRSGQPVRPLLAAEFNPRRPRGEPIRVGLHQDYQASTSTSTIPDVASPAEKTILWQATRDLQATHIPHSQRSGGSSEFDWRCAGTRNSARLRWIEADQAPSMAADSTQHNTEGALPDDAWIIWGPLITTWRPYAQGMLAYLAFSDSVRRRAQQAHLARRSGSDGAQTRAQMNTDHRPLAHLP